MNTDYGFFLIYDLKEITSSNCSNATADFPLSHAFVYDRPFKRLHTADLTGTTITLTYSEGVDTLILYNVNFNNFTLTIQGNNYNFTTVQDPDTGVYNAVVRWSGTKIKNMTITIPNQVTTNSETFFAIGSLSAGNRLEPKKPIFPNSREIVENVSEITFDDSNKETLQVGRSFHRLNYTWKNLTDSEFEDIRIMEGQIGAVEPVIIHEYWEDYQCTYMTNKEGNLVYSEKIKDLYDVGLNFRELT